MSDSNHSNGEYTVYGYIDKISPQGHAYIIAIDGQSYLALSSHMKEDGAGRRYFVKGEEVDFEPIENPRNPSRMLAGHIVAQREPINLADHHELVTLISWDGEKGSAQRQGTIDRLWVEVANIVTEGIENLRVGSQLWCRVCRPYKQGQRWRGIEIEICLEESANEQQNSAASGN
jgi:hypothetical protein